MSDITRLEKFDGRERTVISYDKKHKLILHGQDYWLNEFECSSCNQAYIFRNMEHFHCPFCGVEYRYSIDMS